MTPIWKRLFSKEILHSLTKQFESGQFLGIWYQVQAEDDQTEQQDQHDYPSCEFYNVTHSSSPNRFVVNTQFELYTDLVDGKPAKYETLSTHYLDVLDQAAKMNFNPPNLTGNMTELYMRSVVSSWDSFDWIDERFF